MVPLLLHSAMWCWQCWTLSEPCVPGKGYHKGPSYLLFLRPTCTVPHWLWLPCLLGPITPHLLSSKFFLHSMKYHKSWLKGTKLFNMQRIVLCCIFIQQNLAFLLTRIICILLDLQKLTSFSTALHSSQGHWKVQSSSESDNPGRFSKYLTFFWRETQ